LKDKKYLKAEGAVTRLTDTRTKTELTLLENFLLLAFGAPSDSFLNLLSVKKAFSAKDHGTQDPFTDNDANSANYKIFRTLGCFVSLAK
jgi:hypothetical protein